MICPYNQVFEYNEQINILNEEIQNILKSILMFIYGEIWSVKKKTVPYGKMANAVIILKRSNKE